MVVPYFTKGVSFPTPIDQGQWIAMTTERTWLETPQRLEARSEVGISGPSLQ